MATTLIVPGLRNSGPTHWQTWFETQRAGSRRVEQDDWEKPCLAEWAGRVREQIDTVDGALWIVAHSFGCLASVAAGLLRPDRICGALLVAPADPARFGEPTASLEAQLPFPSLVVASSNDPWVKTSVAEGWALQWGSEFVNIGAAGHINVDSGHGPWPQGLLLFEQLQAIAAIDEKLISIE
ncbi:alpha/beta hydrolase [Dechloromonas sp. XY25]|uniref:Alpha/beta hydrolase n=1 Tax=Dechloromonas hankyongensis TaxID=2908002 RepID=A0ABS9K440_9RHOO|nr:alpha/beta hydrolase [Dechloromonas hankyongensis]MCG2577913.1 alpha/beta hydrolase [Dechloromonas hankyongensis]